VTHPLMHLAGFQACWWAGILGARSGRPWLGLWAALLFFVAQRVFSPARRPETRATLLAAMLGYGVDAWATRIGALRFGPEPGADWPPPWVAGMWLAFAATLTTGFGWLRGRYVLAALAGGLSGPAAYAVGEWLAVVALPRRGFSVAVLACGWAVLLPLLVWLVAQDGGRNPVLPRCGRDRPPRRNGASPGETL
jgi:hypothetical protein